MENRRIKTDLKETYKFINDKYKTPGKNYFNKSEIRLRGHSHKLLKPHVKTNVRKNFWSVRVIDGWNNLPEIVVWHDYMHPANLRLCRIFLCEWEIGLKCCQVHTRLSARNLT